VLSSTPYDKLVLEVVGTNSQDGSGSFAGTDTITLIGGADTVVVHSIANVNFRPGEPIVVVKQFLNCAGTGHTHLSWIALHEGLRPAGRSLPRSAGRCRGSRADA
jgi:hypothetical protein